jgi:very-short-patch-repair endonuclease/predicted transcriptional regulator of viral defense system
MHELETAVSELGARQCGVMLLDQIVELGASVRQVRHWRERGWLVTVSRGLYRLRDHPWTWQSRLHAALLAAGPGAVVSRRSAGRLHGLWAYRNTDTVEVTRREPGDHEICVGTLHRSSWLPQQHVTKRLGFPVTSLARTIFDLAGDPDSSLRRSTVGKELHAKAIARTFNDALRRHGLQLLQETAVLAALAKRGRAGTVLIRELIKVFAHEYTPTESDGESLFVELLAGSAIDDVPRRQVVVNDEQGFVGTLDFVFDRAALNVEIDGLTHKGPLDQQRDRERDERLRALSIEVLRIDYWTLLEQPGRPMRELTRRLRARTAEGYGRSDVRIPPTNGTEV